MTNTLRLILAIAMVIYFAILIFFVRRREINLKYTLLWLFVGVALSILVLFPGLLTVIARLLGFQTEMNALFSAVCFAIILLEVSLTAIVSRLNEKLIRVIQQTALLENRIQRLEEELAEKEANP